MSDYSEMDVPKVSCAFAKLKVDCIQVLVFIVYIRKAPFFFQDFSFYFHSVYGE